MSSHNYIFNRAPHNTGHTRSPIVRLSSFLSDTTVGRCLFPTASASGSSALSRIDGPTEVSVMMGVPSICIKEESCEEKGQYGRMQPECPQRRCPILISYFLWIIRSDSI